MKIILFTTHCPRCKIVDMKLKEKGIDYTENTNVEEMLKLGITSVPYLMVDNELFDFSTAIKWIKEQ